jgi:eukaryotic-like serine/threonine-protein kinase
MPEPHALTTLSGRYEIEHEIGRGGMATVFLARDLRHERPVALKMLHPELAAVLGTERFLAEIRVTAGLQHPNLLPLFDSGEVDGQLYYVMPFVAGESLRARLYRDRQLPVDEAVRLVVAMADALDYAHARGIVHRDLKPENILLQHGQPIIADFGIALAISRAGGARVTQTGLSLGTPQYMSPEQAAGDRALDGRSDIYSLAAILYEMLTGDPPHAGSTVQAVIARVLTEQPSPVRTRRESVPPHVDHAIGIALAKLPADRFATAGQFAEALQTADIASVVAGGEYAASTIAQSRLRRLRLLGLFAAGMLLVVASAGIGWLLARRENRPTRVVRFALILPPGARESGFGPPAIVSPDGRRIAYIGPASLKGEIWIRAMDEERGRLVVGSEDAFQPRFSPDGHSILWYNSSRLTWFTTSLEGGPVTALTHSVGLTGFDWFTGDSIVFVEGTLGTGLLMVTSTRGGEPRPFFADSSNGGAAHWSPVMASDNQTLFFILRRGNGSAARNELAYATIGERRANALGVDARSVVGYAAGAVIYAQEDGAIMALPFDLRRHRSRGDAVATGETANWDVYGVKATLSRSGDLVYRGGTADARALLVGRSVPATSQIPGMRQYSFPRYSPDGRRIALSLYTNSRTDIWIYTIASATLERLTTEGMDNQRPEWSPDGRYVLYRSNRGNRQAIWQQLADGSGTPEQISPSLNVPAHEGAISPDGRTLMFRVDNPGRARDIYTLSIGDTTAKPHPWLATQFDELNARFSPDGAWVVYVSNESGRDEVYVRPYPGPGGRLLVSAGGGSEPLWSRDGRRIFYRGSDAIIAVTLSLTGTSAVTGRDTVAEGDFLGSRFHPMYDVTPDGKRLLVLQGDGTQMQVTVVLNFADAVRARLRGAK